MKLTTSKGNEYTVDWIDGPTIIEGCVILQMQDKRPLTDIAIEFDGLEWLKRESENQGNKEFNGFDTLKRICRMTGGKVQIALDKSERGEN